MVCIRTLRGITRNEEMIVAANSSLFWFLLSFFFFFRYVRANRTIAYIILSFILLGLSLYLVRPNTSYALVIVALFPFEGYIAYLKEKRHPVILRLQKGYKPVETMAHYVIFGIIVFVVYMIYG